MSDTSLPIRVVAYSPKEWSERTRLSGPTISRLIRDGKIESVTVGRARRILTSPEEFFERLHKEQARLF